MFDTLLFTSSQRALVHSNLNYTTTFIDIQNEKCTLTYMTPFYTLHSQLAWSGFSRFEPPTANHNQYWQMLKRKYNVDGNSHYVTHYL